MTSRFLIKEFEYGDDDDDVQVYVFHFTITAVKNHKSHKILENNLLFDTQKQSKALLNVRNLLLFLFKFSSKIVCYF